MRNDDSIIDDDDESDDRDWEETYYPPESGDEDDETLPCPYCGKPYYEDSPHCPSCGRDISAEDAPYVLKPLWIMLTVALLLIAWLIGIAAF